MKVIFIFILCLSSLGCGFQEDLFKLENPKEFLLEEKGEPDEVIKHPSGAPFFEPTEVWRYYSKPMNDIYWFNTEGDLISRSVL